jgi:hypothetical protein
MYLGLGACFFEDSAHRVIVSLLKPRLAQRADLATLAARRIVPTISR